MCTKAEILQYWEM